MKPISRDFCTFFSTIHDVHEHSLPDQSMLINEMAAAAGFQNKLDPLLMQCIQGLPKQVHNYFRFRQLNSMYILKIYVKSKMTQFFYNRNMMTSTLSLVYSWFLWQFQFQN